MTTYYECHITLEKADGVEDAVKEVGWKYSAIDGDIHLGAGSKAYATKHFNPRLGSAMILEGLRVTASMLEQRGCKVLRRKMEHVIFDDRSTKVDGCDGDCVECHIEDYSNDRDKAPAHT